MDIVKNSIYLRESNEVFLEELEATAISGNDILSSTFYVSGLVTLSAGKLTPVCLVLVGVVLYLFQGIYHETVTALPINGGTYNILLNCTSKQIASMATLNPPASKCFFCKWRGSNEISHPVSDSPNPT